jgi:hypothetical protein
VADARTHPESIAIWVLYGHDDGRHAVAPSAEAATFTRGDPGWHRVGPVEVLHGNVAAAATLRRDALADAARARELRRPR